MYGDITTVCACAYCNNNTHKNFDDMRLTEEQKTWNTYKCPHCEEKHKHPTVREEERVIKVSKAEEEIWEYNEQHSDTCCRCQMKLTSDGGEYEANHMLSCASCMRSVHEYGCAKEAELVHGQYWQCEECRASHKKFHPAYRTLQQQTFENIHKTKKKQKELVTKVEHNQGTQT